MGYPSRLTGKIEITSANIITEYPKELQQLAKENNIPLPTIEEQKGLTKQGLKNLKATELNHIFMFKNPTTIGVTDEEFSMWDIEENIETIINIIKKDDRLANGTIIRSGEEQGDVERFIITDNNIKHETATLRWPDGTEV
jgi:hypothetical protein